MLSPAVFESLMLLVTLLSVSPLAAVVSTGMIHQVDEAPNHIPNKTLSILLLILYTPSSHCFQANFQAFHMFPSKNG